MIDLEKFEKLLKYSIEKAAEQLQSENTGVPFYSLCVLASPTLTSFSIVGNTENNLVNDALKYDCNKEVIRWNVGDWNIQLADEQILFNELNSYMEQLHDIDDNDEYDQVFGLVSEKSYQVLKLLDDDGIFSLNQKRDSVYVNLVFSEQSDDELLFKADLLNNSSKVLNAIENGTSIG